MCERPNFEEIEQELTEKIVALFDSWKNHNLNVMGYLSGGNKKLEKKELGTIDEQIEQFISDCKDLLKYSLKEGKNG